MRRREFNLIVPTLLLAPGVTAAQLPVAKAPAPAKVQTAPVPAAATAAPSQFPTKILDKPLEDWVKRLDDRDPAVRELAVRTVPLFGPPAVKFLPKIIDRMGDPEYAVKLAALLVTTSNPVEDPKQQAEIARRLNDLLSHAQAAVRIQAAEAAARVGRQLAAVNPAVIPTLTGEYHLRNPYSYEVRKAAARALGLVGRPDPKNPLAGPDQRALIALLNSLQDSCLAVRIEVVRALIGLGPPAEESDYEKMKSILGQRIVTEKDPALSIWLRVCLMRLDAKLITGKNLEPLAAALRAPEQHVRLAAAQALAIMGPDAASQAGALRAGLALADSDKVDDKAFAYQCLVAIGRMGKAASFLKDEVRALTANKDQAIQNAARDALALIGN